MSVMHPQVAVKHSLVLLLGVGNGIAVPFRFGPGPSEGVIIDPGAEPVEPGKVELVPLRGG